MADNPLDDPELSLAIEQALAPFEGTVPAGTLAQMRREMAIQLSTHPHTAAMLRQLRPDPIVQKTGEKASEDPAPKIHEIGRRPARGGRGGFQ